MLVVGGMDVCSFSCWSGVDVFCEMCAKSARLFSSSSSAWLIFSFASRIFIEAFTMTFVAEWGDRSQLTTIILAARENIGESFGLLSFFNLWYLSLQVSELCVDFI